MSAGGIVRRYWDSSCFLTLLNGEEGAEDCENILDEAKKRGENPALCLTGRSGRSHPAKRFPQADTSRNENAGPVIFREWLR